MKLNIFSPIALTRFYHHNISLPVLLASSMLLGMMVAQSQLQSGWHSYRYTLPLLACIVTLGFWLISFRSVLISLFFVCLGAGWFSIHYQQNAPAEAPLTAASLSGVVTSLPEKDKNRQRFLVNIPTASISTSDSTSTATAIKSLVDKTVQVTDYYKSGLDIKAGDQLSITALLKPASGLKNPGTFDYAEYLRLRGIHLTAYINSKSTITRHASNTCCLVNQWREQLRGKLEEHSQHQHYGLLLGLALGDKTSITERQRNVLQATGTSHLLAISGLHIGLVAGGAGLLMLWLWRRSARLCLLVSAPLVAAISALFPALIYALFAGFTLPTARAIVMLLLFATAFSSAKLTRSVDIFASALLINLIIEPLATMSIGFWLSYYATALIIGFLKIRSQQQLKFNSFSITNVFWLQLSLTAGMSLLTINYFNGISIVAVIANLIAIPWASIVVVPLILIGNLLLWFNLPLGHALIELSLSSLDNLWIWLNYLANLHIAELPAFIPLPRPNNYLLILSPILAVPFAYRLRRWRWNFTALSLLLLSFTSIPQTSSDKASVTVLDVRHSLSMLYNDTAKNKTVLIGSGDKPFYGNATAQYTLLPLLQSQGLQPTALILPTTDHKIAGGTRTVRQHNPAITLYTPKQDRVIDSLSCTELNDHYDSHDLPNNAESTISTMLFDDPDKPFCLVTISLNDKKHHTATTLHVITEDQLAQPRIRKWLDSHLLTKSKTILLIANIHRAPIDLEKIPESWLKHGKLKLIISGELLPQQKHPAILSMANSGAITITAAGIHTAINDSIIQDNTWQAIPSAHSSP